MADQEPSQPQGHEESHNVNAGTSSDDIWGDGSGYTPLAAWAQAGGGNGLFSLGPTDDGGEASMGGTFFANLQAFTVAAAQSSGDEQEEESSYRQIIPNDDDAGGGEEGSEHFRSLADQALLALEDDYRLTLQGEKTAFPSFPPEPREQQQSTMQDNVELEALPPTFAQEFDAARSTNSSASVLLSTGQSLLPLDKEEFVADFTQVAPVPNIDTDKVRQIVQKLQIRPGFQQEMDKWDRQQKLQAAVTPLHHAWIPEEVCRAFRSTKQNEHMNTTQTLSRAATLAHALHRLGLVTFSTNHLVVHILGCDQVEASSREQLNTFLGPLISWMQNHVRKPPRTMQLHLIGPCLPLLSETTFELLPEDQRRADSRFESVQLSCHTNYYHEWRQANASVAAPDLLLAYHPGFWGYDTWKPTLDWLVQQSNKVPLVSTSYTLLEAEEDEEVLANLGSVEKLWPAEYNPFASHQERPTSTAVQGEKYRENSAWQAWRI